MDGKDGYAVFFFPQALESLGEAIKPYLQEGPAGPHVVCNGIDTGGALIEMTFKGTTKDAQPIELELMVPTGMVRMIVSARSDEVFGFGPYPRRNASSKAAPSAEPAAAAVADDAAGTTSAAPVPAAASISDATGNGTPGTN